MLSESSTLVEVITDCVPSGMVEVKKPTELDKQLVPGNTIGAKHCLDSLDGVELHKPAKWDNESLVGPVLVLSKDRTVLHPTHGAVTMLAGSIVECHYQRELDAETKRELRARD